MIANNSRIVEFDGEGIESNGRGGGREEWGPVTDQCPRYRAIGR